MPVTVTKNGRKGATSPQKLEQNRMRFNFHMHLTVLGKGKEHFPVTDEWETDQMVGEGAYGIVLSLRHRQTHVPVPRILKISPFIDPKMRYDASQADAFYKEILYLNLLQLVMVAPTSHNQQTEYGSIVPALYSASVNLNPSNRCAQGLQIMEQFDGTMTQLGENQSIRLGKMDGGLAFYDYQLFNMIQLAHVLDQNEIVHGDLKPRNIIYRNNGRHLKLIDCAFTGFSWFYRHLSTDDEKRKQQQKNIFYRPQIGFPGLPFRDVLNRQHPTNPPTFPSDMWPLLNRLQLYFALMVHRKTWIIRSPSTTDETATKYDRLSISDMLQWINLSETQVAEFLNLYQHKSNKSSTIVS